MGLRLQMLILVCSSYKAVIWQLYEVYASCPATHQYFGHFVNIMGGGADDTPKFTPKMLSVSKKIAYFRSSI